MYKITSPSILAAAPEEIWKLIDSHLKASVGSVCYRGKNRNNNYEPLEKFYTFLGVAGVPEKIIYNFDTQYSFHVESKNIDEYPKINDCHSPEWVHIVTQIAYRRAVSPEGINSLARVRIPNI